MTLSGYLTVISNTFIKISAVGEVGMLLFPSQCVSSLKGSEPSLEPHVCFSIEGQILCLFCAAVPSVLSLIIPFFSKCHITQLEVAKIRHTLVLDIN